MYFFTSAEKRTIQILAVVFFVGLLTAELRDYLARSTPEQQVARAAALEAFRVGNQAYLAANSPSAPGLVGPINVNMADSRTLQTVGGIGPVLAKKIIDYRLKNGYFQTVQDLAIIDGIGPKLILRWRDQLVTKADSLVMKGTPIE